MTTAKPTYSFSASQDVERRGSLFLQRHLYPKMAENGQFVHFDGNTEAERIIQMELHIDLAMKVKGGKTIFIDEKIDSKLRSTIFIETWSDTVQDKPGWAQLGVSHSDALLWAFPKNGGYEVHVLRLERLLQWFLPQRMSFKGFEILNKEGDREWRAYGFSLPLLEIPDRLFYRDDEGYIRDRLVTVGGYR